jgi:hypothetical protein
MYLRKSSDNRSREEKKPIYFFYQNTKTIAQTIPFQIFRGNWQDAHWSVFTLRQWVFLFHTNENFVSKVIDKFNVKKATGVDKISVKLLKLGKPSLVNPITNLINISIDNCHFPKRLKEAQVVH